MYVLLLAIHFHSSKAQNRAIVESSRERNRRRCLPFSFLSSGSQTGVDFCVHIVYGIKSPTAKDCKMI